MLKAYEHLQLIRREQASLAELPIAAHSALLANIHRDPAKGKPFRPLDFCLWQEQEREAELSAEVAAVALHLRAEGKLPAIVLAAWQAILASAKQAAKLPEVRVLRSDDEAVWVLAPVFEGRNVRGGLVAVARQISGPMLLRDQDRPLLTYRLRIPARQACGWLEGGLLLIGEP